MKELNRKLGEMEYDGLITSLNPPVRVGGGTIAKLAEAAVYPRGTLLAKSAKDGLLHIMGEEPAAPSSGGTADTYTPEGILCDDTEVGTEEDVPVVIYVAGCFDPEKVTLAEGYTLTQDDKDKLRTYSIVFKAATPAP